MAKFAIEPILNGDNTKVSLMFSLKKLIKLAATLAVCAFAYTTMPLMAAFLLLVGIVWIFFLPPEPPLLENCSMATGAHLPDSINNAPILTPPATMVTNRAAEVWSWDDIVESDPCNPGSIAWFLESSDD